MDPNRKDIKQFEMGLEKYLNDFTKSDGVDEDNIAFYDKSIKYIIKKIKIYKRQYMGVSDDGIYCNFFILPEGTDMFNYWKSDLVEVSDGGPNFFCIYFDIKTKKYIDLKINGYA